MGGTGMTLPPPLAQNPQSNHAATISLFIHKKIVNYNYKLFLTLILSVRWQCKDPLADTIAQLKAYTYTSTKGKHTDWHLYVVVFFPK